MMFIAGDEDDCVQVTIGKHGAAGDFPAVIDEVTFSHRKASAVYNQTIQVHQRTSVLPQGSTCKFSAAWGRYADNLTVRINGQRATARIAESTQIRHNAIFPEKPVVYAAQA
jgi:hypothetical protein